MGECEQGSKAAIKTTDGVQIHALKGTDKTGRSDCVALRDNESICGQRMGELEKRIKQTLGIASVPRPVLTAKR